MSNLRISQERTGTVVQGRKFQKSCSKRERGTSSGNKRRRTGDFKGAGKRGVGWGRREGGREG